MQERRPSLGVDRLVTIQSILSLHDDRPDVMRKVQAAFDFLYSRKPGPDTPKALMLQSLLTLLEYCGDFTIQTGILSLIIMKEDVKEYVEWFAKQWFEGMPKTICEFINLVPGMGERNRVESVDVTNFLIVFNNEKSLQYVVSVLANNVKWNKCPLRQSVKTSAFVHLNCGTRTLSITGLECRLPKELATRGAFLIKSGEVQAAHVLTLLCPFGTEIHMISIESSVGHLIFQVDPLLSNEEWIQLQEFFEYIFKVNLQLMEGPKMLQINSSNISEPSEDAENKLVKQEPPKSLVSSSSQDSANCLLSKVLPNQENIQMCDQLASQPVVSASTNKKESSNLSLCESLLPSNEDHASNDNAVVGSTCDGQKRGKALKRKVSSYNKEGLKGENGDESENEHYLSSTEITPCRRETRSLSRTRGQPKIEEKVFKKPKQQKRGGGGGKRGGRGGSHVQTVVTISDSGIEDVGFLNEPITTQVKPALEPIEPSLDNSLVNSLTIEGSEIRVQKLPSMPTLNPLYSTSQHSSVNTLIMECSESDSEAKKLPSMPTLDTPYATPQHECSNQAEMKVISINDNDASQPIPKSHEILLSQLEECEALRSGPPPAIPLYSPSNIFNEQISNNPLVPEESYSLPRTDPEPKKAGSDIESDTSLLESAVQSAVLLPDQYPLLTALSPAAQVEKDLDEMDPLHLEEESTIV